MGENYEGEVTGSFWDTQTSGQATNGGGLGKTTDGCKSRVLLLMLAGILWPRA